jgi:hypothetical protein
MRQKTETELLVEVQKHAIGNRAEIEASKYAGCFSCCAMFDAKDVYDWQDEWTDPEKRNRVERWAGECPRCGRPGVIGSGSGLLEDQAYLPAVNDIIDRLRASGHNGS